MIILSLVDHESELARYRTINLYDLLEKIVLSIVKMLEAHS